MDIIRNVKFSKIVGGRFAVILGIDQSVVK